MTLVVQLLGLKNGLQKLVENYFFPIPPLGVILTQGIQAGPQSHLEHYHTEGFNDPIQGLTCAIGVSAQHQPHATQF